MYNVKHDAYGRVMQYIIEQSSIKEKHMFNTAETVIDTFTTAQKQAIKFIQNEAVAKSLTDIVEAQAQTAKTAVKVSTDAFTTVGKEVAKTAQEVAKADYITQATEYYTNFWKEAFKPATTSKAK
jgi:hypothetical protein